MRGFYGYRRYLPKRILLRIILLAVLCSAAVLAAVAMSQMKSLLTRYKRGESDCVGLRGRGNGRGKS